MSGSRAEHLCANAELALALNRFGPICRREGEEDTPLSMQDIRVCSADLQLAGNMCARAHLVDLHMFDTLTFGFLHSVSAVDTYFAQTHEIVPVAGANQIFIDTAVR